MATEPLYDTDLPIRVEIIEAQREAVAHWAQQGTWWTGAERLAIVKETRTARDADPLEPWIKPSSVDGLIPNDHVLPSPIVDIIWRLTNHPGTLTHGWYEELVPTQISTGHYVELVGLVAQATLVDRFADGLDLDRIELPAPEPGEPTGATPEGATQDQHWVPTAPIEDASWKPAGGVAAQIPNVRTALSLVPPERRMQWVLIDGHYVPGGAMAAEFKHRLDRSQIELIGARTSAANECFY